MTLFLRRYYVSRRRYAGDFDITPRESLKGDNKRGPPFFFLRTIFHSWYCVSLVKASIWWITKPQFSCGLKRTGVIAVDVCPTL